MILFGDGRVYWKVFRFRFFYRLRFFNVAIFCFNFRKFAEIMFNLHIKSKMNILIMQFVCIITSTGYLITSIISSNIALSLGMVGALSIIRFRTPVKNPAELVYYFMLITWIVLNVNKTLRVYNLCIRLIVYINFGVKLLKF